MSRDRFRQIHRYLNFCNETAVIPRGNEGYDKLFKVRMLLDDLCPKFRNLYKPKRDICIDESMIPFKGRISFRQFIPSKRTRFGIKAWVMTESATGYILEFLIYTGKDIEGLKDHDLAGTVVRQLTQHVLKQGYHLYLDNYYTEVGLLEYLYENKIYATGTARVDRSQFPKEIIMKTKMKLQRGYSDWRMCGPVLAQVWIDSKPVHILSTIHYPNYDDEVANSTIYVKRKGKKGAVGGINVPFPPAIKDYNANMGGVDSADQIMKYYNCGRKSSKWYRRIFYHLLEICIHNAFVLESWFTDQRARSHQSFREELIDQLIGSTRSKNSGRPSNSNEHITLRHTNVGVHKPLVNDKPRDCKNCSENVRKTTLVGQSQRHSKGIRRSRVFCSLCNVHLRLDSVSNCWNMWHS